MATLIKRKGSDKWYARFQVKGVSYTLSTGKTAKVEAREEMARLIERKRGDRSVELIFDELLEGIESLAPVDRDRRRRDMAARLLHGFESKLRIAEAWETWQANPKKRNPAERTMYGYRGRWDAFKEWLDEHHATLKYLHEVTPSMAEAYASHLWAKGISPATYNAHLNFLRSMFRVLRVQAGLTQNVWADLPKMEREVESRRELTTKELRKVCRQATGSLRYMFALGLYTGMRLGDVCTLQWQEVDLRKGFIVHKPMKTRRRNKIVRLPIHPVLEALLRELKRTRDKKSPYLFPVEAELYTKDRGAISKRIQKLFTDCKIKTTERIENGHRKNAVVRVGFHSLRHSFVSLCAAKRVPEVAIMELVGHGSPAMTRLYSHAGSEQKAKAIAALPAMRFGETKLRSKE